MKIELRAYHNELVVIVHIKAKCVDVRVNDCPYFAKGPDCDIRECGVDYLPKCEIYTETKVARYRLLGHNVTYTCTNGEPCPMMEVP